MVNLMTPSLPSLHNIWEELIVTALAASKSLWHCKGRLFTDICSVEIWWMQNQFCSK